MPDLLVPLFSLPEIDELANYSVRKPMAYEAGKITSWVSSHFSDGWGSEIQPALSRIPATMLIVTENFTENLVAFCVWDCTALGFLGPVGVAKEYRQKGIGKLITLSVLHKMKEFGYGYSIIGSVQSVAFFQSVCDLSVIDVSSSGIYPKRLICKLNK